MNYKILQIMPAPSNMYSVYEEIEEDIKCPIVCLALVEYEDGGREIISMDTCDGLIDKAGSNIVNFKSIEFN
jgi:hypothetical protein